MNTKNNFICHINIIIEFFTSSITITYDDQPPIPLSTVENYTSISGLDISANGANQTWIYLI